MTAVPIPLRVGGALREAEVTSVDVEPVGVGVGLLGELARVRPLYAGNDLGAPATVIVKLPSPHEANRAQGMAFGFYERGRDLVQALTDRAFTAVLDLDAASLLPSSVP